MNHDKINHKGLNFCIGGNKRRLMILMAMKEFGLNITPTKKAGDWEDSFTIFSGKLYLWFNTPDGSTHIYSETVFNDKLDRWFNTPDGSTHIFSENELV